MSFYIDFYIISRHYGELEALKRSHPPEIDTGRLGHSHVERSWRFLMHITLIQPRYSWGAHIYLPNGLVSLASRIMKAGHTAIIFDENIDDITTMRSEFDRTDIIGIGIMGAPYAPEAIRVATALRKLGLRQPIVFGGEFVNRLNSEEYATLFSNIDDVIATLPIVLDSPESTSMAPALEMLSEHMQRAYFSREFCLYTSQGCIYGCKFCAADKQTHERFRDADVWESETRCLAKLAKKYTSNTPNSTAYISSLDACQNPKEMERMLQTVYRNFTEAGVTLTMRCLATAKCTVKASKSDPKMLERWREYGLQCISLGVDGDDPAVWARENKRHNTASDVRDGFNAIRASGIFPEATMVIGLPNDSARALVRGSLACLRLTHEGIRIRPYLGKAHAPGSEGWQKDHVVRQFLLTHPDALRELDYGSLGSPLTHKNERQRRAANIVYLATVMTLKTISFYGCPTQPLMPTVTIARTLRPFARAWNRMMPADV